MGNWATPDVAEQWKLAAADRNRHLAAATEVMFALGRIAPGTRVLDLGTGSGDVAVMAAERVGPRGTVVATDSSQEMGVPSIKEQIAAQKRWPLVANLFAALDKASRERAWAEIERRWLEFAALDGTAVFPTEMGATR